MANKPSERRNFKDEEMELNLTPMMNLISILIPVLLVSAAFVEMAVVNVSAPAIGTSPPDEKQEKPEKPPLNLTLTITDKGYTLAGSSGVLGAEEGKEKDGPTIPVKQASVKCGRYLGTWPPPRALNKAMPPCTGEKEVRQFWVYDRAVLSEKLLKIKDEYLEEKRIIIAAEPGTEFEAITDVMDTSRDVKDEAGERRELFPEVVLSPGVT